MPDDVGPHTDPGDCWNHIGVLGDATCPVLPQVGHCYNCPVYVAGRRQLPERAAPETSLRGWTPRLAQEQEAVGTADTISVLIFRLGTAWLALPTHLCTEVAEMRTIHSLPHRSGRVLLGLVNIRGELQLCIALHRLLGLDQTNDSGETMPHEAHRRLVVVERVRHRWVFVVDEVHGIHYVHPSALDSVPVTVATDTPVFTQGIINWHEQGVGYLDPDLVFAALEREIV